MICDMTGQGTRAPPEFSDAFKGFIDACSPDQERKQWQQGLESNFKLLDASQKIQPAITNHFAVRRFCVTKQGLLGQVPKAAEIEDCICVFRGAVVPYMVRYASGRRWRLVGIVMCML